MNSGSISYLGQYLINHVLEITYNQEIIKNEIYNVPNYLIKE
jgi:hypothetical protein